MSVAHVVTRTYLPGITPRIGRSRDVYELEGALLFVETDRINAYNWLIPTGIPNKGRCLHQLSAFWFEKLDKPNHMITADINMIPLPEHAKWDMFAGRSMFVRKCKVIPILCIVREYLTGTGWLEYQTTGSISGQMLPSGLKENDKLPEPIFTPSIEVKRTQGTVSKNVTMEYIAAEVGNVFAASILEQSLEIFKRASEYALTKGLILADTKLEFGVVEKKLVLVDEILTPDCSRFWYSDQNRSGGVLPPLLKRTAGDYLVENGWTKDYPPPELPGDVVEKMQLKYVEVFETLTGKQLE